MSPRHKREHTTYPKHHRSSSEKIVHPTVDVEKVKDIDDVLSVNKSSKHYHSTKNKSTMFLPASNEPSKHDVNQEVVVTVNVNEAQDDCCSSFFSNLAKCFGRS